MLEMKIKTPCPKCGKKKMIKTVATMTRTELEIRVLNRCYKCRYNPKQRYLLKSRVADPDQRNISYLIRKVAA